MKPLRYLYYPYINFRNENWLKNMALFSDSVSRTVPHEYPTIKTETVLAMEEAGLVENLSPAEGGVEPGRIFRGFLVAHAGQLRPRYGVDRTEPWASDPYDDHLEDQKKTRRAYVEASKLGWTVHETAEVEATGLVLEGRDADIQWIGMHPRLANIYMTLLANGVVERCQGLELAADFASHHVNVHASTAADIGRALLPKVFLDEQPQLDGPQIGRAFATFAFHQVIPKDLGSVPIERILELREAHHEDFVGYQEVIDKFVKDRLFLEEIKDADVLGEHIREHYEAKVEPSLKKLKRGLRLAKVKYRGSAFAVSFTTPLRAVAAGLGAVPLAAGNVGGAFSLRTLATKTEVEMGGLMERNRYSWLYRVERGLKPETLIGKIAKGAGSFGPSK